MKIERIKDEINAILELTEGWEALEDAPQIEIDIAKQKLQNLYLMFLGASGQYSGQPSICNTPKAEPPVVQTPTETQDEVNEALKTEALENEAINRTPELKEFEGQMDSPVVEQFSEVAPIDNTEEDSTEEETEPVVEQITEPSRQSKPSSIGETNAVSDPYSEDEDSQQERVDPQQVKRLHYINNLFGGDRQRYEKALSELEAMESFEDVLFYVSENFNWSSTSEAAQSFVDTYARKF
ncbi:MAG: hypothetical protein R3Y61_02080 [Rikenellaceae bacterium]